MIGFGPYKDTMGRYRTQSLFYETSDSKDYAPPYSLKKYQHADPSKSLYLIYMEMADPAEYNFAQAVLGSWDHWLTLQECAFFKPHIEVWREDLKAKLRARHIDEMRHFAETAPKISDRISATRWLAANSGYEPLREAKRGRPSKQEVEGRLKRELERLDEDRDDIARLGLE